MAESVQAWALSFIGSTSLPQKIAPGPVPERWEELPPLRVPAPGRPAELEVRERGARTPKPEALRDPRCRARVLHTFWHHELQAAELMCWALLAFPATPLEFRRGLVRVALDEIRHMGMYQRHIEQLGFRLGEFPVRDWFWKRVPGCSDEVSFVALMGMGFEAANLEHAPEFASWFRAAGDEVGAALQEQIAREELAHVRFGTSWFTRWKQGCRFEEWQQSLPAPLSPWVLRGKRVDAEVRRRAGMPDAFIDALIAFEPELRGGMVRREEPSS